MNGVVHGLGGGGKKIIGELLAQNVKISPLPRKSLFASLYLTDPDGGHILVYQQKRLQVYNTFFASCFIKKY